MCSGGSSLSPVAGLTSEGRAVTSRRRWLRVTSRPRDESRYRDAAPGHAGPPRARPGDSGDSGSGGSGDSGGRSVSPPGDPRHPSRETQSTPWDPLIAPWNSHQPPVRTPIISPSGLPSSFLRFPIPPPRLAAPLFHLLLPGGPGGAPRARPGGTAALGALLRCFPCERLCGGCAVPPGALPPAMPPPARRRLPPAARLPPRTFRSYLPRSHRTYSCVHCRAHLARHEELISKSFQGSHGRAYLFNSVVNVGCGPAEQRLLLTGLHSVADIFCQSCKTTLGWKYEQAFESSQKYKEGKFIIEMSHMVKENGWD
ncbi:PREDICTED: protein yippee-like 4 [Pseudopodoces humilis]|nr:PREDICTED: protein yippee-like 4 [Pseudopodoces humilis]